MGIFAEVSTRVISATALVAAMMTTPMAPLTIATAAHAETAVPAEKNPPGDIPDSQVFIDYTSKLGFTMKVPEGWARSDQADGASFVDKLDGIILKATDVKHKPDVAAAKSDYVGELKKSERAVKVSAVKTVKLPSGEAIRIVYTSNSEPNAVTNKQVRLENERYLFYRNGKLVTLELYAPKGADNVDQWRLMSRSFTWK
jgi:hypothetical protein